MTRTLFVALTLAALTSVAVAQPAAPVANPAVNVTTSAFDASWSSVPLATNYYLDVSTDIGFGSFVGVYNNFDAATSTTVTVTGLTPGTTYYYRVRAKDIIGTSVNSNTITVATLPDAPAAGAATGMSVSGFTANWGAVAGATSYKLDVSTNGAFSSFVGIYNDLDVGNVASSAVSGLAAGTTYFYRVRGANLSGSGANSGTISVITLPVAPTATAAAGILTTSFSANWGGVAGATSYKIDASTDSLFGSFVGSYNNLDVGNVGTTLLSGLTAGTRYFYRIRGANASGSGANSNTIATLTLPAAPTATGASDQTETSFRANWSSVPSAGVYLLDVATDPGFSSIVSGYNSLQVNAVFQDVVGLSNGTTYWYRVRARNSTGDSGNSNSISTVLAPPTPVPLAADSISTTGFRARWNNVPLATSYELDVALSSGFGSLLAGYPVTGIHSPSTTYAVGVLTAGTTYYYRLRAVNVSGTSPNSTTITTITLPPAPVAIAGDSITSTAFRAKWNAATGAASYTLDVATDVGFTSMVAGYPKALIFTTLYPVVGLTGNTPYWYRVRAVNASGISINSGSITLTTLPTAPTALAATSVLFDRFTANWSSVPSATGYRLDVATDAGFTAILPGFNNFAVSSTSQVVIGLSANTTYHYRVRAEGPGGTSSNSNTISQLTVPAAPVANSASNVRTTKFTANWSATSGATGYRLDVSTVSNFSSFVAGYNNKSLANTALSDSVIGLSANTLYYYRVRAVNAGGTSDHSNVISQMTAPAAPVANAPTAITTNSFSANWSLVGGATSYKLDVSSDSLFGSFLGAFNNLDVGLANTFGVTGLGAGARYFYRLRAANAAGASDNSNIVGVSTTPLAPVIQAPTSIAQSSFQANWSASAGATEYRLYVARDSLFGTPLGGYNPLALVGTSQSVTGLTAATRYFYRVKAYNGTLSAYSDSMGLTTLPNAPAAPVAKAALNVSHVGFRANWDSSSGATEYRLDVATNSLFTNFVAGYNNKQVFGLSDSVFALTPNTTYWYRVRAVNIAGPSANSNVISPLTAPAVPTASAATLVASRSFVANWSAVAGATGYRLDVATDAGFTAFVSGYNNLLVAGATQKIRNLAPNTQYFYRVRSLNTGGTSGNSATINLTTLAALAITTTSPLPAGAAQVAYSQSLIATGGLTPYTWTRIAGRLPGGISLSSAGLVNGTPPTADTASFVAQVMDADSATATMLYSLTINNPVPTVTSITPAALSRGQTYAGVSVVGTNFLTGATTLDLGPNIAINTVTVDNATHLTANVTVGGAASVGQRSISVVNPGPGGGTGTLVNGLTVDNLPSITGVLPVSGLQGQTLDVTLTGTDFIDGQTSVLVGGGPSGNTRITIQNTTVNSPTSITVTIHILPSAEPGPRYFVVSNPGIYPLGGLSNQFAFSVGNNPVPHFVSITPNVGDRLQSLVDVVVRGTEFYQGITSLDMGPGITVTSTTIDSVTKLRANMTIAPTALTGARKIYVVNAAPGGGKDSLVNGFTVRNPAPTLSTLSVNTGNRLQTLDITMTGNRFIAGVTTVDFGTGIRINTTTVDSASQLRVNMSIDSSAALGARNVSVSNPAPGGGTSTLTGAFTVNNPGSGLTSILPTSKSVGDSAFVLTVNGSSFVPGSTVRFDSTAIVTTYVTTIKLTASVPASLLDTGKVFAVTVSNPGAGLSNSLPFTVNNPLPVLTSMAPDSARRLDTVNVLLTGSGFVRGFSTITVTPVGEVTLVRMTYTSSTLMTATLFVTPGASLGAKSLVVVNPLPGGGSSVAKTFRVWGNPAPGLVSITPDTGSRLQTMNVYFRGSKFIPAVTKADFGPDVNIDAIRVDSSRGMLVGITIAPGAATGARTVAAINPAPGGDTARLVNAFTIINPAPTLSGLTPSNADLLQTVIVTAGGHNFINGVTTLEFGAGITINGPFTVVNDSTLQVSITVTAVAVTGPRNVTVRNSAPGGGFATLTNGFVVGQNPRPQIESVTPALGERLGSFVLVVRGTGFLGGVTSVDVGTNIVVGVATVDSATKLSVPITIKALAYTGLRDISVTNAPPGGGSDTMANGFSVQNPRATLVSLFPTNAGLSQTLDLVFKGRKFIQGVTGPNMGGDISVNGTAVVGDSQMTANITIAPSATIGARKVFVENPLPGGGRSDSLTFSIDSPGAPLLSFPADNASNQLPSVALRWSRQNGAQGYRIQVGTTSSFPLPLVFDDSTITGNDTTITVNSLTTTTTFYWRVSVRFGGGVFGPWSSVRAFSTLNYPVSLPLATTLDFASKANAKDFLPEEYRLIGLPGASNLDVSSIMPGTNDTDWQAYWDAGSTYVKWSDDPATFKFSAGRGFWFIRKGQWKLNTTVTSATLDGTGAVVIPLHKDWNIITNPFTIPVTWVQVSAANPASGIENAWSYGRPATGYSQATSLDTYVGYYILNPNNTPTLRIPYPLASGLGKFARAADDTMGWRMTMGLRVGAYAESCTEFGVHPAALEGKDSLDMHMPPAMGETPSVFFDRPQWDQRFTRFATDIRREGAKLEEWTFNVSAPPRVAATLNFMGRELLPTGQAAYVIDDDRAQAVNLREVPAYLFSPARRVSPFRVLVGTVAAVQEKLNDLLPKEIALGPNFPNPFNPTTTIPVALPHAAFVQLTVVNILGEEVKTLANGPFEAGRHWITWDGRNNVGRSVATGVYLYRLTVDGANGMTRKMVLVK